MAVFIRLTFPRPLFQLQRRTAVLIEEEATSVDADGVQIQNEKQLQVRGVTEKGNGEDIIVQVEGLQILGEFGMLCRGELSHEAVANREGCVGRLVVSILEQNLNLDREMVWEYLEALPIGYVEESKNSFLLVFPSQRQPVHVDKKKSLLLDLEFVLDPLVSMGLAKAWGWRLNACLAKSIIYDETKGGHFLCRQLNKALILARFSAEMAEFAGDDALRVKCRLNEAYSLIWAGRYKTARHIIENEYKKGVKAGRVDSQGLAQLALSHCTRAKQANRMLKDAAVRGEQGDPLTISDDWHRMRTVAE